MSKLDSKSGCRNFVTQSNQSTQRQNSYFRIKKYRNQHFNKQVIKFKIFCFCFNIVSQISYFLDQKVYNSNRIAEFKIIPNKIVGLEISNFELKNKNDSNFCCQQNWLNNRGNPSEKVKYFNI